MAILEKFEKDGSILNKNGSKTPESYKKSSVLNDKTLVDSQLDMDGKTPQDYDTAGTLDVDSYKPLIGTNLDLDGKTPSKYLDNPPS